MQFMRQKADEVGDDVIKRHFEIENWQECGYGEIVFCEIKSSRFYWCHVASAKKKKNAERRYKSYKRIADIF